MTPEELRAAQAAYRPYYDTKLESGKLYQDFVIDCAWSMLGLAIVQYSSRAYQAAIGESRTGVEIKNDQKFHRTRNLWIELAEKARPRPGPYAESGINRGDNSWLYVIGDYDTIFFFPKHHLKALAATGRWQVRENHTKTSLGFLMKEEEAHRYRAAVLRPNAKEKVQKIVGDLETLGRELHAAARANPSQLSLFI